MDLKQTEFVLDLLNNNYIVRDHHVHGVRILPGVTFIDIIYRLLAKYFNHRHFQLTNILFKEPIATSTEFDKRIHFTLTKNDDQWKVVIKSEKIKNNMPIDAPWVENMECELSLTNTFPDKTVDISALKQQATQVFDMDDIYGFARRIGIEHFVFMKTLGKVYWHPTFALMELNLSQLAEKYRDRFYLHPAFLDGATFALVASRWQEEKEAVNVVPFIPFYIKEFQAKSSFSMICYVYVDAQQDALSSQDTISRNINIYDAQGNLLSFMDQFTVKRIRSKELITKLITDTIALNDGAAPASELEKLTQANEQLALPIDTGNALKRTIVVDLQERIAGLLKKSANTISITTGYYEQGLSSSDLLKLVRDLEKHLHTTLYPTLLFEYTTINELADFLLKTHGDKYHVQMTPSSAPKTAAPIDVSTQSTVNMSPVQMIKHAENAADESMAIAIVGLSGRYADADNVEQLWKNLIVGKDSVGEIPRERWDYHQYYSTDKNQPGKSYGKWGSFLKGHDEFDPLFFSISPKEAVSIDPQQRLFLEIAWETFEDAGITHSRFTPDIGVFVGVMFGLYQLYGAEEARQENLITPDSTYSSIANRVSYFLGLTGPSMAIDTMCSSSLTALHLACDSLRRGECVLALAGGVNVISHPFKYLYLSERKFLSTDGKCRSFGKDGDGYVPGEGVGAVLLKPLKLALAEGDHIYGVIRGSSLNHNGRTNGFTVPNPQQQTMLIEKAIKQAGIDPNSIGYIEAHGTGTSLGDPIEIVGLAKAFHNVAKQSCPIGSVKSNLGHLESAAGIIGLTKVLLQMQHRQLASSIHADQLNPNINFNDTPFYVQRELTPWQSKAGEPLRASISSFGAGGSNAHVIVEEAPQRESQIEKTKPAYLILLSGKQAESLTQRINDLNRWLNTHEDANLAAIAYTLDVGRSHFAYRSAFIVETLGELKDKIAALAAGKKVSEHFSGVVTETSTETVLYEEVTNQILAALQKVSGPEYRKKLEALANLYIKGYEWQGNRLYDKSEQTIISLPTYPFLHQRYWVSETNNAITIKQASLHPLVGWNASSFNKELFKTQLLSNMFFLEDHRLADTKVLPGAAYLEMALVAGELAAEGAQVSEIREICWRKPLIVPEKRLQVEIELFLSADGEAKFEIRGDQGTPQVIYSQGILNFAAPAARPPKKREISSIESKLLTTLHPAEIYTSFNKIGLNYGPRFQPLQWIKSNGEEALSYYQLPKNIGADRSAYKLHPTLLDGVFQSVIGLNDKRDDNQILKLPFKIARMKIYGDLPDHGYVHVKRSNEGNQDANTASYDLEVWDENGEVLLTIEQFICQAVVGAALAKLIKQEKAAIDTTTTVVNPPIQVNQPVKPAAPKQLVCFQSNWVEQHLTLEDHALQKNIASVCVWTKNNSLLEDLKKALPGIPVINLKYGDHYQQTSPFFYEIRKENIEDAVRFIKDVQAAGHQFSHFVFADALDKSSGENNEKMLKQTQTYINDDFHSIVLFVQSLLHEKINGPLHGIVLYSYDAFDITPTSLWVGFSKTLLLEKPNYLWRVVGLDKSQQDAKGAKVIVDELQVKHRSSEVHVRYRFMGSVRQVEVYMPLLKNEASEEISLRQGGVYLITGGLGGLGLIFAKFLAKTYQAKLILTGRSALDVNKEKELQEIRNLGADVDYVIGDVCDLSTVKKWIAFANKKWGFLHGIIHSAGLLKDMFLLNKKWDAYNAVLQPKVIGSLTLHTASQDEKLDFFVLFSSIAGCLGNVGQSDYASANSFIDHFAHFRAGEVKRGKCYGKTISLDWPLWLAGGMQVDEGTKAYLEETMGMIPLPTEEGLKAFVDSLRGAQSQYLVFYGYSFLIEQRLSAANSEISKPTLPGLEQQVLSAASNQAVPSLFITDLQRVIGQVIELAPEQIAVKESLTNYGFDSVSFTDLSAQLKREFALTVAPTLYFEHPNVTQIAEYLWNHHRKSLSARYLRTGDGEKILPTVTHLGSDEGNSQSISSSIVVPKINNARFKPAVKVESTVDLQTIEDIAIIGMAGRFPQSENVDELWEHLINGHDLMSEIPNERWDWHDVDAPHLAGFMPDVDKFDAGFFNLSPREVELMDPQQRLFLQTVWAAMEDAGYMPAAFAEHKTGLFVGVATHDYLDLMNEANLHEAYSSTGNAHSVLANRVSYLLNLRGPSAAIDTACSSSLVALHQAVKAIQNKDCEWAVVGGVNAMLSPGLFLSFTKAGMLSLDGHCKTFDKDANGYARGEGVGAIILKPLAEALKDHDHVLGIIKGSSVNHGGRVTTLTAPNPAAQAELIISAYAQQGIRPDTVGYIETHGTGTSLGDPIEINGLKQAFTTLTEQYGAAMTEESCAVGSIKANTGHLEAAAGIISVIKVLLMMKHKRIPPQINFKALNPYINFTASPFYISQENKQWYTKTIRRAGISSFGFGGANAHVILEEGPTLLFSSNQNPYYVITLSAREMELLKQRERDLLKWLKTNKSTSLAAIAYTLNMGRYHFEERSAFVVRSVEELIEKLEQIENNHKPTEYFTGKVDKALDDIAIYKRILKVTLEEIKTKRRDTDEYKEQLAALANLYVKGYDVNLNMLQEVDERISLPTYPFRKDHYWLPINVKTQKSEKMKKTIAQKKLRYEFFVKEWQPKSMVKIKDSNALRGKWIILVNNDSKSLAEELLKICPNLHAEYINIDKNAMKNVGFAKTDYLSGHKFKTINKYDVCLDLSDWYIAAVGGEELPWGKIGFLQAMIKQLGPESHLAILHFTHGLADLEGKTKSLSGSSYSGLIRMLGNEYKQIHSKTIDIDLDVSAANTLLQIILAELTSTDKEVQVAYRNNERFIPILKSVKSCNVDNNLLTGDDLKITAAKSYIITGGTGGIGALLAHEFVARGARKLILMGYHSLPKREDWPELLKQKETTVTKKIKQILSLESRGAQVEIYTGELSNRKALHKFLIRVHNHFGPIGGVVHCAGLIKNDHPAFINKKLTEMQAVCEPKIKGLQVLNQLLKDEPLDFFILFSSVASVIPALSVGFSDYAMANAFMNDYASYQRTHGKTYYRSMAWGNWKEVGMGEVKGGVYYDLGLVPHTTSQGLAMFDAATSLHDKPFIINSLVDVNLYHPETWLWNKPLKEKITANETIKPKDFTSTLSSNINWLKDVFSEELRLPQEKLAMDTVFEEFGVDSILLASLLKKIEERIGEPLAPSLLLEHNTLNSLSHYFDHTYGVANINVEKTENHIPYMKENFVKESESQQQGQMTEKKDKRIAVIGLACHFPGSKDKNAFWDNLSVGKSGIREVPPSRWDVQNYYSSEGEPGKSISKWGGFIEDIEYFDPPYFGISEADAPYVDPLIRQFLEVSVQALRDAGYEKEALWDHSIGVFVGSRTSNFVNNVTHPLKNTITGVGQNFIAAHLAQIFNFTGPNLVVDTACSSSLVSIHLACQSLLSGESDIALAGGVDILLDETPYLILSEAKALSPDGMCHTFDEKANGFVPGEGAGVVLLKPLAKALTDGDHIYAVIEGTAVNNDGHTMGITTPNPKAQQAVIEAALKNAGVKADSISYIETHGTGTMIGDPMELRALTTVFRNTTNDNQFCAVGSVKSNIGHLLSAAGIASFIKVVLSLQHQQIVPTLHCEHPNPRFDFKHSPFFPNTKLMPWQPLKEVRRAGISSFGFGGTNVHIIVGELPSDTTQPMKNVRSPLPPIIFKRRYYWPVTIKQIASNAMQLPPQANDKTTINAINEEADFKKYFIKKVITG